MASKLLSKLILLMNIAIICGLTCDEVLEFPAEQTLTLTELRSMPPKDIMACLAHLGKEQLPKPDAEYIWQTIIKFYDGIVNIPDHILMLLHWITIALKPEDYANITLSNIDIIENFGLNYNLDESQLSAIANRVHDDFAGKEPEDYTYYDLTALRQILCVYNRSEIQRIHPKAYREAALVIGKLEHCNPDVMSAFAILAVHKHAFGKPENWSEMTIRTVGKVVEYLPRGVSEKLNARRISA